MPLIKLETSAEFSPEQKEQLLTSLSKIIVDITGKQESHVMITIQPSSIAMAGSTEPAALADIRGIGGLDQETNSSLSAAICSCLTDALGIDGGRIYLNFTDIARSNWGWNGETF